MTITNPFVMHPNTSVAPVYETIFVTKSGIIVQKPAKQVRTHHMLVWYPTSRTYRLNDQTIDRKTYNRILVDLQVNHPDSCVVSNAHNVVFVYPVNHTPAQ